MFSKVMRHKGGRRGKKCLVPVLGVGGENALETYGIAGCFDPLERGTQEASLSLSSQHVEHVMLRFVNRRGVGGGLHCIATQFHLHTGSGQAAGALVMVHVAARVCDSLRAGERREGEQSNRTQINSPVALGSRTYMCLMVERLCMHTQRMMNY